MRLRLLLWLWLPLVSCRATGFEELSAREGVRKGMAAGSDLSIDPSAFSKEEREKMRAMLYNQRARPAPEGGLL